MYKWFWQKDSTGICTFFHFLQVATKKSLSPLVVYPDRVVIIFLKAIIVCKGRERERSDVGRWYYWVCSPDVGNSSGSKLSSSTDNTTNDTTSRLSFLNWCCWWCQCLYHQAFPVNSVGKVILEHTYSSHDRNESVNTQLKLKVQHSI